MLEIRFHGRGGQGTVVAAELLAQAAFREGKYPQSFPFFGVERRGAPVTAFARIDDGPILLRTSITDPEVVVVLDGSLLGATKVTAGLRSNGLLLVNTNKSPDTLGAGFRGQVATVDATRIALAEGLGSRASPIVNTAVLGALARATGVVSFRALMEAIQAHVPANPEANGRAAMAGYRGVTLTDLVIA